ncbi:MAG: hypothetical protein AAB354_10960, partial [candidate division KSB1 bacterium]
PRCRGRRNADGGGRFGEIRQSPAGVATVVFQEKAGGALKRKPSKNSATAWPWLILINSKKLFGEIPQQSNRMRDINVTAQSYSLNFAGWLPFRRN